MPIMRTGRPFSTGPLRMNSNGRSEANGAMEYVYGRRPASERPVAMPIMFCSATPTLMQRSGYAAAIGSIARNPTSPVSRTTCGSAAMRPASASKHAVLRSGLQFARRDLELARAHREIVPVMRTRRQATVARLAPFHERHAAAERRLRQDYVRPAMAGEERVAERRPRMAVDLRHGPPERVPPRGQMVEVEHVTRPSEGLLAIHVDHRGERVQAMVGGKHGRLPGRSFVALGVAHQAVDVTRGV